MRRSLRQQVRQLYEFRCGYCGVSEIQVGSELTIDHFQPRSAQGTDDLDNLVYCCFACNTFKGDWWSPTETQFLLHPRRERFEVYLQIDEDGIMRGLTEAGIFHIDHLQLNREPLVLHRQMEQREREWEQERVQLLAEISATHDEMAALLQRFGIETD